MKERAFAMNWVFEAGVWSLPLIPRSRETCGDLGLARCCALSGASLRTALSVLLVRNPHGGAEQDANRGIRRGPCRSGTSVLSHTSLIEVGL